MISHNLSDTFGMKSTRITKFIIFDIWWQGLFVDRFHSSPFSPPNYIIFKIIFFVNFGKICYILADRYGIKSIGSLKIIILGIGGLGK